MAKSGYKNIVAMPDITLKFSWSQSSQSVADNTTTISWKMELNSGGSGHITSSAPKDYSIIVNGTTYKGTNTIGLSKGQTITLASGTTNIGHNADGTKTFSYSFSQDIEITYGGSWVGTKTGSGSGTLNAIPRESSFGTVSGNTIGGSMTVNITRNVSSYTHQLWYKVGNSVWYDLGNGIETSKTFPIDIATCSQFPNATSGKLQLCLQTYSGSTKIGGYVYKDVTVNVPVKNPTLSNITMSGVDLLNGYYVQGKSKLKVGMTATAYNDATIKSCVTTIGGVEYTGTSFTSDPIQLAGKQKISFTVTDSRGFSNTYNSTEYTIHPYTEPKITKITVTRDATTESTIYVTVRGTVSAVNNQNAKTISVDVGGVEQTVTATSYTVNQTLTFANAPTDYSVEIIVTLSDSYTSVEGTYPLPTVAVPLDFLHNNKGIAIGKVAENDNECDVAYDLRVRGKLITEKTQKVLYNGSAGFSMEEGASITLGQAIADTTNGIILVFVPLYNNAPGNFAYVMKHVPKEIVAYKKSIGYEDAGFTFDMASSSFTHVGTKHLVIKDEVQSNGVKVCVIKGHADNIKKGTQNGIAYDNSQWVLRYVLSY
jgi:hypothetical protein